MSIDGTDRIQELRRAISEGELVSFLDTINTLEEFDELVPALTEVGYADPPRDYVSAYRKSLTQWPDPQLPVEFARNCPRVAAKIAKPQQIRVFLRGADFCHPNPEMLGCFLEDILRQHEDLGRQKVTFSGDRRGWRESDRRMRDEIACCDSLQVMALVSLILPKLTARGESTKDGIFFDWRSKEERLAAGEAY